MQNNYSSDRATPPTSIRKNFKRIVLTGITLCLVLCVIFSFAACLFGGDDDADPTTPGQTEPETPSSDSDNPGNSNENDDDSWDDVIVPDDPVIDPDLPTDPDLPVDPAPPEDIPPEDVPPQDTPPGDSDTSDFPKSIYEVDEIDEINYFADEFALILNNTYLDRLSKYLIGRYGTAESFDSVEWYVSNNINGIINELYANVYYTSGNSVYFKVGKVSFDAVDTVQDIINGNLNNVTYSVDYQNPQSSFANIENNTDLGKTVIQTIDADNTLEGDIWCSIGGLMASGGRDYRIITVYQITENGVEKYELTAEAPSADPTSIIANIQAGKYTTTSQSTEYTFTGMKIEQIPLPEEA